MTTAEAIQFHYRTNASVAVEVTSPDGTSIADAVTVKAGLGTAWRPPAENLLTSCSWISLSAPVRTFALAVNPSVSLTPAGVYYVWFRLTVAPLAPLVRADVRVVIFGGP
jgi:hypothetical protein